MVFTKASYVLASLCAATFLAAATSAAADGVTTTLSGFGTVGGSFTSDGAYAYRHDVTEYTGASRNFDLGLESRLGLQAVFDFGAKFSVTVQEVARERGDKTFDLGTEWFYAEYRPSSDWTLRLGRVALAPYLLSDSRQVGYADPWFHAPNEVYASETFQYVDGGQILWHRHFGAVGVTLQSSYGSASADEQALGVTAHTDGHDVANYSAALECGDFLFRIAQTHLIYATILPLGPNNLLHYDEHDKFTSLGFQYDNGRALVLSEWTKRAESLAPVANLPVLAGQAWYVAGGWRFGKLTPLIMVANTKQNLSLATPAGLFTSESLTLRYDVMHNVALKAQATRAAAGNFWYWTSSQPQASQYVGVFALGIDFVF